MKGTSLTVDGPQMFHSAPKNKQNVKSLCIFVGIVFFFIALIKFSKLPKTQKSLNFSLEWGILETFSVSGLE
jgi:hypothetical protein